MQVSCCLPVRADNTQFTGFERPNIIGYTNLEKLMFAKNVGDKMVHFDLNLHLDKAKINPEGLDVKLTELLTFLLENEKRLQYPLENILNKAKFFCSRSLMTIVACTPYEKIQPWKIVVVLHKGNIYLSARYNDETLIYKQKLNLSARYKKFSRWGYKFQQYMLSDTPYTEPNPNVPCDETRKMFLVFMTHLKKHTIVYKAEMDGIRCDKALITDPPSVELGVDAVIDYLSDKQYIELKTNRHIESTKQESNFRRYKTRKWWCQSFLAGVEDILCGFRNDAGIVEELKMFKVQDLPKESQNYWDPNVCLNFLNTFFTHTKRCLAKEIIKKYGGHAINNLQSLPIISMIFEWSPGKPVQVNENYNHDDDHILPDWFINNYGQA